MRKINTFNKSSDFYAVKRSLPYPSISYIREMEQVFMQQLGKRIPNVGDVVLYDKANDSKVYVYHTDYNAIDYPLDKYTPIGVVVIPQDFLAEESEARMMSLVDMSAKTPETGSTSYEYMNWGGFAYDGSSYTYRDVEGLENLSGKLQQNIGTNGELIGSQNNFGYLPSDKFANYPAPSDKLSGYYDGNGYTYIPSPYDNSWDRSILYGKGTSGDSFLADINGKANTDVLIAAETLQSTWQTDDAIISTTDGERDYTNHFPPALCCARFHTEGTLAGDWYCPAIGELGFLMPRWNVIKAALAQVRAVAGSQFAALLSENDYYWSSSEYSQYGAYSLYASNGGVYGYSKGDSGFVRALSLLSRTWLNLRLHLLIFFH